MKVLWPKGVMVKFATGASMENAISGFIYVNLPTQVYCIDYATLCLVSLLLTSPELL